MFQFVVNPDRMTRFRFAIIASMAFMSAGCGKSGTNLTRVTGRVTYKNAPVADAMVMFLPEKGPIAMGRTNMDGEYSLRTGSNEGCSIGHAAVSIQATTESNEQRGQITRPTGAEEMKKAQENMKNQMLAAGKSKAATHSLFPVKYADSKTSGLTADVKPPGISANFDLQ